MVMHIYVLPLDSFACKLSTFWQVMQSVNEILFS